VSTQTYPEQCAPEEQVALVRDEGDARVCRLAAARDLLVLLWARGVVAMHVHVHVCVCVRVPLLSSEAQRKQLPNQPALRRGALIQTLAERTLRSRCRAVAMLLLLLLLLLP